MASDRPIFIVGCPRSGSSMLRLMLNAHPRIALPPSTRFVLPAYERRHAFGDLRDPVRRRTLARWIAVTPGYDQLGIDDLEHHLACAPPTLGSTLGTVFQLYAAGQGKPRWGDRRNAYLPQLPALLRMFPDAQIINLIRDGRDCVASLKESWCRPPRFGDLIDAWARAADASKRAACTYGPDVYHQLRYEDLIADPAGELHRICGFLGEEYTPAMVHPGPPVRPTGPGHTISLPAPPAAPVLTASSTSPGDSVLAAFSTAPGASAEPASTAGRGFVAGPAVAAPVLTTGPALAARQSWRQRLTPEEIVRCEAVLGSRLSRFGYAPLTSALITPADWLDRARLTALYRTGPARLLADRVWGRVRYLGLEPSIAARLTSAQRRVFLAAS